MSHALLFCIVSCDLLQTFICEKTNSPNVEVWMVSLCGSMTVVGVATKCIAPPLYLLLIPPLVVFSDQLDSEECIAKGKCDAKGCG